MATKSKSKAKKTTAKKTTNGKSAKAPHENKTQKVIAMLKRPSGCTREQVLEVIKWKAISLQGVADKAGLKLKLEKVEGKPIVYRAA
jgi:hypothetical protein